MSVLVTKPAKSSLYQLLPSVEELLHHPTIAPLVRTNGQSMAVEAVRVALTGVREQIAAGTLISSESVAIAIDDMPQVVLQRLDSATAFSLRPAINATGVILHIIGRVEENRLLLDLRTVFETEDKLRRNSTLRTDPSAHCSSFPSADDGSTRIADFITCRWHTD